MYKESDIKISKPSEPERIILYFLDTKCQGVASLEKVVNFHMQISKLALQMVG